MGGKCPSEAPSGSVDRPSAQIYLTEEDAEIDGATRPGAAADEAEAILRYPL